MVVRAKAWLDSPGVTLGLKLVAIVSLLLSLTVGVRQYALANCLARWNNTNNAIQSQRSDAAQSDRKALDQMVSAIAGASEQGPADARNTVNRALRQYLMARAFNDGERAANPLPEPPSEACR